LQWQHSAGAVEAGGLTAIHVLQTFVVNLASFLKINEELRISVKHYFSSFLTSSFTRYTM